MFVVGLVAERVEKVAVGLVSEVVVEFVAALAVAGLDVSFVELVFYLGYSKSLMFVLS